MKGTAVSVGRTPVVRTKVRIPPADSMPVERLDRQLDSIWHHRLGLVTAPAGSGKTTLLARFAARAAGPVGWYRAEAWDGDEAALLGHIEAALTGPLDGFAHGWQTVADAANALDAWTGPPVLLVIDDLHTLAGSPAEDALERLIEYAPQSLTILAAGRVPPRFNLSRLRVSGALIEIGGDDLRFRSWEVERLFRDYYGEPLPPEELARLARRTEGWAAGLQLFHLATSGKGPDERRRVLAALGPNSRLMRDYLTRNVLEQLPAAMRLFLVETSVLGRLNAELCDSLLERGGSSVMLAELARRHLFTQALSEDGSYRYHELLRSYLQGVLLEDVGEAQVRARLRRAGELLADAGALPEALEALCRAEDWQLARALLDRDGGQATGGPGAWLDALPTSMVQHDPWLLLATARRLRAEGRLAAAVDHYQRAERAFGATDPARICHAERQTISAWLDDGLPPGRPGWAGLLRTALAREPLAVSQEAGLSSTPQGRLVAGLALLAGGEVAAARRELSALAEDEDVEPTVGVCAALAAAIGGLLAGNTNSALEVEGAAATAERIGFEWLARLGRASLAIAGGADAREEARAVAAACASATDRWGAALSRLFAALGSLSVGTGYPMAEIDGLALELRALGSPVLEAWARGLSAVAAARAGEPDARDRALQVETAARTAGVPVARSLSYRALGLLATEPEADDLSEQANLIASDAGFGLLVDERAPTTARAASVDSASQLAGRPPPVSVRLFGSFALELDGAAVHLGEMRPRVRSLLRLLSLYAGTSLHHETIEAALWPEADAAAASRNLHVAIAGLRRALEPNSARGDFLFVRRDGDGYSFVLPAGSRVDLQSFERAVEDGRHARERGLDRVARAGYRAALDLYHGELLSEEGPAEWVAGPREAARLAAVEAAQALAELMLAAGEADGAARVCNVGLRIERYHDPLWRLLIQARDEAGDQVAAKKALLSYSEMLAELGVRTTSLPISGAP